MSESSGPTITLWNLPAVTSACPAPSTAGRCCGTTPSTEEKGLNAWGKKKKSTKAFSNKCLFSSLCSILHLNINCEQLRHELTGLMLKCAVPMGFFFSSKQYTFKPGGTWKSYCTCMDIIANVTGWRQTQSKIEIGQDCEKYYTAQEHAQHDYILVRAMYLN